MTRQQFSAALAIAKSETDLTNIDDSIVFGCGLPEFKPVYVTVEVVAKLIRWQAYQWDGTWIAEEIDSLARIAKRNFLIV